MSRAARPVLLGVASLIGGCVYLNSFYNAQNLFDEAERATWVGRDADARPLYDSVVVKAARSYRQDPEGGWADDALYLLGRAYLRRGEPERAEAALRRALEVTADDRIAAGARLHLGVAAATMGKSAEARALLNDALRALETDPLRAEGHLWRARILLEAGQTDAGWSDLDRAAAVDPRYRVAAGLERMRWGVAHGDPVRAREGAARLFTIRDAHVREDTVRALVGRAARRWGPEAAVEMLAGAHGASWPPAARDRLLLARARYRVEAGDATAAIADASSVADGAGEEIVEARILIARVLSHRAREVDDLASARAVLLPAVGDARVLDRLESIRTVELLVERAEGDGPPESLFAAGEIARDELEARELARSLLLRYAAEPERPWAGKALLAALDLTSEPTLRSPLLRRIAEMRDDPYVMASASTSISAAVSGAPPARVLELDAELQQTLTRVVDSAVERARQLDALARERSGNARTRPDTAGTSPDGVQVPPEEARVPPDGGRP